MKKLIIICYILICLNVVVYAQENNKQTAGLNQLWLKSLVSIEIINDQQQGRPIGSGFIVLTPNNHLVLVTAKHVVYENEGRGSLIQGLAYRLNNKEGSSLLIQDNDATKRVKSTWLKSPINDVACRIIIIKESSDIKYIPSSIFLSTQQIQAGAPLFIIGFPMGLRSDQYATPIVRRGIVSRNDGNNIIIDGFVFPGNSGGPVIYVPSIQLEPPLTSNLLQGEWLVGLVSSNIPYIDVAVSQQTKRARITFEENSGLCNVLPADKILELLNTPEFKKMDAEVK